jgi:hypothetical protein
MPRNAKETEVALGVVSPRYRPLQNKEAFEFFDHLDACSLVQTDTDLAIRLQSMDGFDHRTLQDIHDLIAAWFRFSQDDGGQLRLGESDEMYTDRLAAEWRAFFEGEVNRLSADDEFARAVLVAAAFGNTERGYAAEAQLREILKERYRAMKQPPAGETKE